MLPKAANQLTPSNLKLGTGAASASLSNSVLMNLKGVKLSFEEQEFIKEYRQLEELEREKGIKFF